MFRRDAIKAMTMAAGSILIPTDYKEPKDDKGTRKRIKPQDIKSGTYYGQMQLRGSILAIKDSIDAVSGYIAFGMDITTVPTSTTPTPVDATGVIIDYVGVHLYHVGVKIIGLDAGTGYLTLHAGGRIGIGTNAPDAELEIYGDGTQQIFNTTVNNAGGSQFVGRRARAGSTASQANDTLVSLVGRGHDGTSFLSEAQARIQFAASQNTTGANQGAYIQLETTPNGSTTASRTERVRIPEWWAMNLTRRNG